jgi:hypothetical protein
MAELKHYRQKVETILKDHESARNNDGSLYAYFLKKYCSHLIVPDANGDPAVPLKNFKNLPPMENIRRSRQIIQNDNNLYLPSDPAVRKARKIKEENWRNAEVREAKNL